MSTRWAGRASRKFRSGSSDCPPARTLASSRPPSMSTASAIDVAAWYSKGGGFTGVHDGGGGRRRSSSVDWELIQWILNSWRRIGDGLPALDAGLQPQGHEPYHR